MDLGSNLARYLRAVCPWTRYLRSLWKALVHTLETGEQSSECRVSEITQVKDPALGPSHDGQVLTPSASFFLPRLRKMVSLADA